MEETRIEETGTEGDIIEDARAEDLEEIDTIIAELEVSKGRGNLILSVVNSPAYRDGIIRALSRRLKSKVIPVQEGEDVIQNLKNEDFGSSEVLIWTMPEKLTPDLADALNNFRELFYDAGVPSLVFMSQSFLDGVIRRAPDFWRYRGNYHELKGRDGGLAFEAIGALSTSLHYQSEADLLRRKRINEHLLEKVKDEKQATKILNELAQMSYLLGDYNKASDYLKQELKISTEIRDKEGVAKSLHNLGMLAQATGHLAEARRLYGVGLKTFQELGDKRGVATSLHNLGTLSQATGDIGEAHRLYSESLKIAQELGNKSYITSSLISLGVLAWSTGNLEEARHLFGDSLKIAQELGDKSGVSTSLHNLGGLAQANGDVDEARRLYGESLKIQRELGDKMGMAESLNQFALLEEAEGNLEHALDQIHQAEELFKELGSPMAERVREVRERLEKKIANVQM